MITSEIRHINDVIATLDKRKETLGLNQTGAESSHSRAENDLRRGALFAEDAELVGIDINRKKLKSLLLDEGCRRTVIAVVGTGGLGNTLN